MNILLTGATGYIGSRLAPRLLAAGHQVSALVRTPSRLASYTWAEQVRIVAGDVSNPESLQDAFAGVDAAYYLIHSMGAGPDFHEKDRLIAEAFSRRAKAAGVAKVVFLGALGDPKTGLTEHLRSRHETGVALASSGINVIELRAGPVVGAGSLPFEMIRYLTERVPIMICPRWVFTKVQPIGLGDVLNYLVKAIDIPAGGHQVIEIGGSEVVSYGEMMTGYAQVRGLRRAMIRVPVLTPRLSSLWVHLITPLRGSFARPIVEGLRNEVVVRDKRAETLFPEVRPVGYQAAVQLALDDLSPGLNPVVVGSDAKEIQGVQLSTTNRMGLISERREIDVAASPERIYQVFSRLGGNTGWYMDWGWKVRGLIDRLFGGPGMRKTEPRDPIAVGDQIDFWHVEEADAPRRLRLRADMKLPGDAWLEFQVAAVDVQRSRLVMGSYFAPKGVAGVLYWFAFLPFHKFVFNGLARRIRDLAQEQPNLH